MSRRRILSQEDRRLWDQVADQVTPLDRGAQRTGGADRKGSAGSDPRPEGSEPLAPPDPFVPVGSPRFRVGQASRGAQTGVILQPGLETRIADFGPQPNRRTALRERRGKVRPEARIDLHGMTQAQAHGALTRFILGAQADGLRLVLVITGKGKPRDEGGPLPVPVGILRHQVPHWLSLPPLRGIVLRLAPAHIRHGGDGALYVFLRRNR
ncbi:MAG: Smr/MutS family protein [Qingshengfaniella sp.]